MGGRHEIDVMDPDPLCQGRFSSFVRRFIRSPSFSKDPAEFLRFLDSQLRARPYDVVLPTHEQVYLLSRFRDSLSKRVGLAMPPFESLERMQNKASFSRLLVELALPQPQTTIVTNRNDLNQSWSYPFYLKLPHSTAGSGVFLVNTAEDLRTRVEDLENRDLLRDGSEILVQRPGRGVLSTVQAVFNSGELIGVHTFEARRLGVGGMSTARVSVRHEIVHQHVARMGAHLNWHGALFIDYFFDREQEKPEYIECNPRIGETVNAMLSGANLPELLVRISNGETPQPAGPTREGVLTHNILMISMSAAYDGETRRAIWREQRECAAGRGLYENSEDEITRPREDPLSRLPRIWTTAQLLACPAIARRIVSKTVANYALPESATARIKRLPLDLLERGDSN
ncbi:MAG TPA: hypothetical protein VH107_03340 [Lacipirellulaceae bacterium]|nr:hypothetical protein [Lacipirellulaceae bacterium]